MRILHVGLHTTKEAVNGVSNAVSALADGQADLGHSVWALVPQHGSGPRVDIQRSQCSADMVYVRRSRFMWDRRGLADAIDVAKPDIVHMHSVFVPTHVQVASFLLRINLPYVASPHGGLNPMVLSRRRLVKLVYRLCCERSRFRAAAGIGVLSEEERNHVSEYAGCLSGIVRCLSNAIDACDARSQTCLYDEKATGGPIGYFGRFDVEGKGLDILCEIAEQMPEREFLLFGRAGKRDTNAFRWLRGRKPRNVILKKPVYGLDKLAAMRACALVIQPSRWEVFGNSVAEAMGQSVPCAVSMGCALAREVLRAELGLVFPLSGRAAAPLIRAYLADESLVAERVAKAREYAVSRFAPRKSAERSVSFYRDVLRRTKEDVPVSASVVSAA